MKGPGRRPPRPAAPAPGTEASSRSRQAGPPAPAGPVPFPAGEEQGKRRGRRQPRPAAPAPGTQASSRSRQEGPPAPAGPVPFPAGQGQGKRRGRRPPRPAAPAPGTQASSRSRQEGPPAPAGPVPFPAGEDLVAIGRVTRPHGVRGEIRVQVLTDFPERFEDTSEVCLVSPARQALRFKVQSSRPHHGLVLLKLAGIDTPEAAGLYRGWLVMVPESELVELEEGEYWHFQLEGLEVRTPEGEVVGRLTAVLSTPAHDIYAVAGPRGEVLIPAVEEYVLEVNLERGVMTVKLPEIH